MGNMLLIVNPAAGKERIRTRLMGVVDTFIKGGWQVEVYVTQSRLDASRVAADRGKQVDLVVCSGGDGTLSETISGLLRLEEPPLLGYIPAGSTNDYASSLRIPAKIPDAAANVLTGTPRLVDVGQFCSDRNFIYIAGFGLFTEVSYITPQQSKNLMGHQAYVLESVKSLANIKSYRMKVEAEEFSAEEEYIFGMVTNTTSVGGFKGLLPKDVALDDGLFEVMLIRMPKTPMELTNILSSLAVKDEYNAYVHRFVTSKLKITCEEEVDWVLDGEFGGSHKVVEIENLRRRIKIVTGNVKKS